MDLSVITLLPGPWATVDLTRSRLFNSIWSLNKILNWTELICSVKGACSFRKSNKWNAASQPTLECYWLALQSVIKGTKAGMCFQYESFFRRIIHLGDLLHKKTFTKKVNTFLATIEQDLWELHLCMESWSGWGSACSAGTSADTLCSPATVYVFSRQTRSADSGQEDIWMVKVNVR